MLTSGVQCPVSVWFLIVLLSHFSRVWLCVTPIDSSPPGSPIPGILQARTLEWVAISFANAWKWKVKVKSLSHVWLFVTPWTAAYQASPPMGFSRQEYWSGVPLPSLACQTSSLKRLNESLETTRVDVLVLACLRVWPFFNTILFSFVNIVLFNY